MTQAGADKAIISPAFIPFGPIADAGVWEPADASARDCGAFSEQQIY